MARVKRPRLSAEARRANAEQLTRLGNELRLARKRRRLLQRSVGVRAGLSQSAISRIECGRGGSLSLDAWQRVALSVGRPLRITLARDRLEEPADAGHLAIQELVAGIARRAGYHVVPELASRSTDPRRSVDLALLDERAGRLILVEVWNSIGDIGAALRSTARKLADLEARPPTGMVATTVGACWVVRATPRNRALIGRYPELFTARFRGSSAGWCAALIARAPPPGGPGIVWADGAARRLFPWRRSRG